MMKLLLLLILFLFFLVPATESILNPFHSNFVNYSGYYSNVTNIFGFQFIDTVHRFIYIDIIKNKNYGFT
jgi:hypothetical protein